MTTLSSIEVNKIFMDCLFSDGEPTENHVTGAGIMMDVGFNPERLEKNKPDIIDMIDQLPNDFKATGGGGMSFLNMCVNKDGEQWGEQDAMDQLVTLGTAIGKMTFPLPKEMWKSLPGGVPYICVS